MAIMAHHDYRELVVKTAMLADRFGLVIMRIGHTVDSTRENSCLQPAEGKIERRISRLAKRHYIGPRV